MLLAQLTIDFHGVEMPSENGLRAAPSIGTFLSLLPDMTEQHAVLRRLTFLEEPASFFYDGERPMRAEEVADPYRRGILLTARATSRAERTWLREALGEEPPTFS